MKKRMLSVLLSLIMIFSLIPSNGFVSAAGDDCLSIPSSVSCTKKIQVSFSIPEGKENVIGLQFIMTPPAGYTIASANLLTVTSGNVLDYSTSTNRFVIYNSSNDLIVEKSDTPTNGKYALFEFVLKAKNGTNISGNHTFKFKMEEIITTGIVTYPGSSTYTQAVTIGHGNYTLSNTIPATCTEEGKRIYSCACGDSYYEPIAALGHDEIVHSAQIPTCTGVGWNEYVTCSRCNYSTYDEISKEGHKYSSSAITTPPTCKEEGVRTYTCENCGDTSFTEKIPVNDEHKEEIIPEVKPTCVSVGYTEGVKCSVCDKVLSEPKELSPTGHSNNIVVNKKATCIDKGSQTLTCTLCGAVSTEDIPSLGHARIYHSAKAPTCLEPGWDEYATCSRCNYTTYSEIAPVGHNMVARSSKAPTCSSAGWTAHQQCSRCDYSENKVEIPTLPHDVVEHKGKPSTCTAPGYTDYVTCNNCYYNTRQTLPATGHSKVTLPGIKPTCTSVGYTAGIKCEICGKVYEPQNEIPAINHNYKKYTTKATLTKNGKIVEKCTVCNDVAKTTKIYAAKTVKLSASKYTYNGKAKKPSVVVKNSKGKKISSSNYTVTYAKGRKNIGKYKVTIKFKNNYKGTKTLYFTISPKKVSDLKIKSSAKKQLTISWKKDTKVSGYEIVYATNSKFTKGKTTTKISSYKTTKKVFKKLSSKKTYYVKVRSYKKVSGKTYYGAYCKTKSVKIK